MKRQTVLLMIACLAGCTPQPEPNDSRSEVVFWHFWGGRDLAVVDDVIGRFNESQSTYRVRGVAMPGANLDLKLFLSVAGGDPPDVMNHDDPIVADWAHRGALTPLDELASAEEIERLNEWLYPAARRLGEYDRRAYALVNGLDIRALYYNATWLEELNLAPPETLADLDRIADAATVVGDDGRLERVGYLPDPRRLWAWGVVFGGRFADGGGVTLDSPRILAALEWMHGYAERYGPDRVAEFRTGDQALTGAAFPLLAGRRYAAIMDGQWRVRDLAEAEAAADESGDTVDEYGVVPLPPPAGGVADAGWVNGNFFIVPKGARNAAGAWAFMKFWTGLGHEAAAAETAAAGGWIPASPAVVAEPAFQRFLKKRPRFRTFVGLAASENQHPTPALPIASFYYREVNAAAQDVVYRGADPHERLTRAADRVRRQLAALDE